MLLFWGLLVCSYVLFLFPLINPCLFNALCCLCWSFWSWSLNDFVGELSSVFLFLLSSRCDNKSLGVFDFMQCCTDQSASDLKQRKLVRNFVQLEMATMLCQHFKTAFQVLCKEICPLVGPAKSRLFWSASRNLIGKSVSIAVYEHVSVSHKKCIWLIWPH